MTFAVYAALGGVFFLVVVNLQVVAGYSPLQAGIALLPDHHPHAAAVGADPARWPPGSGRGSR